MLINWKSLLMMALTATFGAACAWAYEGVGADYGSYYVADGDAPPAAEPMAMPEAAAACDAPACDACCEEEEEDEGPCRLFCQKECGWNWYGFVEAGITANGRATADRYNGVLTFNDRREGQLNQLYVVGEKTLCADECSWDWGGRVDIMFGSDYVFNQMIGFELRDDGTQHWNNGGQYGLVIPQLYAQFGNDKFNVKVGRFYTPIGYEVVPATGNFFYSHTFTHQYGEPFFHAGILGSYAYNDNWSFFLGVVNGWDTLDREPEDFAGFIAGATWTNGDDLTVALSGIASQDANFFGDVSDRYMYSLVITKVINDCWTYVLQHDNGFQEDGSPFSGNVAEWYGVNQYLFRKINDCWTAGVRFEWFRDDDGARVTGIRNGNAVQGENFAGNFFGLTAGLNYKPTNNLIIRPELRYDWFDGITSGPAGPYNAGTEVDQFTAAVDIIWQW